MVPFENGALYEYVLNVVLVISSISMIQDYKSNMQKVFGKKMLGLLITL